MDADHRPTVVNRGDSLAAAVAGRLARGESSVGAVRGRLEQRLLPQGEAALLLRQRQQFADFHCVSVPAALVQPRRTGEGLDGHERLLDPHGRRHGLSDRTAQGAGRACKGPGAAQEALVGIGRMDRSHPPTLKSRALTDRIGPR